MSIVAENNNLKLAIAVLNQLSNWGISDVIICPGGRNSPILEVLSRARHNFKIFSFFDERTASFFALGKSKKNKKPVAVITTSGTAVAELLPAVIEAFYKNVPLVLITADRPSAMRGSGAPQTIEQLNIFSSYVEKAWDIEGDKFKVSDWQKRAPLHLNICFGDPLVPKDLSPLAHIELCKVGIHKPYLPAVDLPQLQIAFADFLKKSSRPILLLSESYESLNEIEITKFLAKINIPIYAESTSGFAWFKNENIIVGGEQTLLKAYAQNLFDGVIRLGGVPTHKLWRLLEDGKLPLLNLSEFPFAGVSHAPNYQVPFTEALSFLCDQKISCELLPLRTLGLSLQQKIIKSLQLNTQCEVSFLSELSKIISPNDSVYIGNSLPIREWELVENKKFKNIFTNRGANGIDGQLATALGMVNSSETLWVVLGDLTYLYDMNAHWAVKYLPADSKVRIVCVNNGGGKIFEELFNSSIYYNSHDMNLEYLAKFWSVPYLCWKDSTSKPTETWLNQNNLAFIEIKPDSTQSSAFWKEYKK